MINRATALILGAATSLVLTAAPALGGDLYVVHGIPGADLGLPNALPVDIALDGVCTALTDVPFEASAFAATLDGGIYQASVHLANGGDCSGPVAVTADITIPVVGAILAVAHLDQNGLPTLSQYSANLGDVGGGLGLVQVVHTAAAPTVDVKLKTKGAKAQIKDLGPGEQAFPLQVPAGPYDIQVKPASGGKPVLKLEGVPINGDVYTAVFAVGSPAKGSFSLLPVEVIAPPAP